jgi:caffeoyl-CoA O-methyltransferase
MHPDWRTDLLKYCESSSSPEPAVLKDLARNTWLHAVNPRQLSGHLQGRFLSMISSLMRPDCILEIGTFTGYSALCLAEGLSDKGVLHSLEADAELAFKATSWLEASGNKMRIEIHHGRALELIPTLNIAPSLIFVDAEKQEYKSYCDLCLPILTSGGVMLFDNTLWSMKVLDEDARANDPDTATMHEFNQYLAALTNVELVMLPLRDGLTMLRKK